MHEHLRRLDLVWIEPPVYFITVCTKNRRKALTSEFAARVLIDEWQRAREHHLWVIGRYVIMPDHVHFFCRPEHEAKTLSRFVGSKTSNRSQRQRLQLTGLFGSASSSITYCARTRATAKNGIMSAIIPCEAVLSRAPMIGLTRERLNDSNSSRPQPAAAATAPSRRRAGEMCQARNSAGDVRPVMERARYRARSARC